MWIHVTNNMHIHSVKHVYTCYDKVYHICYVTTCGHTCYDKHVSHMLLNMWIHVNNNAYTHGRITCIHMLA